MSDDYKTDKWIQKVFQGWHDPCPYKAETDGLHSVWEYRNFINPPYSNVTPWVDRSIEENQKGNICVLLLKVDTSTNWFKDLQEAGARFLFVHGRLTFGTNDNAPFPSMLVVFTLEGTQRFSPPTVRTLEPTPRQRGWPE